MNQKKTWICLLLALYSCVHLFGQLVVPNVASGFYPDSVFVDFDYPADHTLYLGEYEEVEYVSGFYLKENTSDNSISEIRTNPVNASPNHIWLSPKSKVRKAQLVYYKLYKDNALVESGVVPYFIGEFNYEIPIVSIIIDSTALFGYEEGIYIPGLKYDENPNLWQPGNYYERGRAWEREALIHFYDQGDLSLTQGVGVRLHGGGSRIMPMKSLRLYARESYGTKELAYPFFEDKEEETYKRIILRNGGQDFTKSLMRDGLAHSICQYLDVEYQAIRPVIVFINGSYWGIHNMRERYDKHYFKNYHDEDEDDIDVIEIQMAIDVDEGTDEQYLDFVDFYTSNDLSNPSIYDEVEERMDIGNYIDYHISKVFFGNRDWPGNNTKLWKPQATGYKWRWALSDYDDAMKNVDYNSIQHSLNDEGEFWPNPEWSTLLFRKLVENKDFKERYKNRLDQLLTSDFSPAVTVPQLQSHSNLYRPYIEEHIDRWNYPKDISSYEDEIAIMEEFLSNRGAVVKLHYDQLLKVVEDGSLNTLSLYPNPTRGLLRLESKNEMANYTIHDLTGRVIETGNIKDQLDLSGMVQGQYIINVFDSKYKLIGSKVINKI